MIWTPTKLEQACTGVLFPKSTTKCNSKTKLSPHAIVLGQQLQGIPPQRAAAAAAAEEEDGTNDCAIEVNLALQNDSGLLVSYPSSCFSNALMHGNRRMHDFRVWV